jgi:DNA polymerase elongation subunit (family B)
VETYLFDLQADPAELVNLVGLESHRAVADRMQRRLVQRMVEAGEEAPLIVAAEPRPAGQRRVSADEVDM